MKHLLIIHKQAGYFKVTGGTTVPDTANVSPDLYLEVTEELYAELSTKLGLALITFPEDQRPTTIDGFSISELSEYDAEVQKANNMARSALATRIDFKTMMDLYLFTIVNNELVDKGIVITDDNREEQYLKVVTKHPDLIEKLEMYLEIRDRMNAHLMWYSSYLAYERAIRRARLVADVKAALDQFLEQFH